MASEGIKVDFTPRALMCMFSSMEVEEQEIKGRFQKGLYAHVHKRLNGSCSMFVVLWDESKRKPFLFTLKKDSVDEKWMVESVDETCPFDRSKEVVVTKRQIDHASSAFYKFRTEEKRKMKAFHT